MLGFALSTAILNNSDIQEGQFWLTNTSGARDGFENFPNIHVSNNNQDIANHCDIIILCVPPDQFSSIDVIAKDKLVISVMAGVSIKEIQETTQALRVVRAMSSPAAISTLAYSPWFASASTTPQDKDVINTIFSACGTSDQVEREDHIEVFTAMTGPVPGFVAFFAQCMSEFATSNDISKDIANRAVKQLFLGAGTLMATQSTTPAHQVQEMIDYDGTTAAGLRYMQSSAISEQISEGLQAAVDKTKMMTQ